MRLMLIAAVGTALTVAVSGIAQPIHPNDLPQCLRGLFRGITQTTETGEVVGDPDRDDWGCAGERPGATAPEGGAGAEGVPIPPSRLLCIRPAAPNPATSSTTLGLSLPTDAEVRLAVYGQSHRHGPKEVEVVRTLFRGTLRAGEHRLRWDLLDDAGARVEAGIYRVALHAGNVTLCGDIEVR